MRKILTFILAICMILPCGIFFTACGSKGETRVMNVSLNPSVEFVLDKNNKVVTVNATNDEGNYIVANATFTGLSAEDAVDLFLKTVQENGFMIQGDISATANELKIEISGKDAQKLFNSVKKSAKEYIASLDVTFNVSIDFEQISKDDLKDLVEECMQDLTDYEINNMSQTELVNLIKKSREETANILSQELKELYYETRAEEILKAKFTEINNIISNNLLVSQSNKEAFSNAFNDFITNLDIFKTEFENMYLTQNSEYQIAMQAYIKAKKDLLEARLSNIDTTNLEMILDNAKHDLELAKSSADNAIRLFEEYLDDAIDSINTVLSIISNFLNQDTINNAINTAKDAFQTNFNNEYTQYINNNYWEFLTPSV